MAAPLYRFKRFSVAQEAAAHPIGTDSVLLGAWADVAAARRILDVGTGTGVVALMLAQRTEPRPETLIDAVEIDPDSAGCAAANFAASPWADRLKVANDTVQHFAQFAENQYDLIVCNPPFFTETTVSPHPRRRLVRNTLRLSSEDLITAALRMLRPQGRLCVILPVVEGRRFCELATIKGLYCSAETRVYPRPGKPVERLLLQFMRDPRTFYREEMAIYSHAEVYSFEFQQITRDFYLFFR